MNDEIKPKEGTPESAQPPENIQDSGIIFTQESSSSETQNATVPMMTPDAELTE